MSRIRRLYRSAMVLYPGGPAVWGRWEWCPPGAALVPQPHVFGSSSWDPRDQWTTDPPIGEQRSLCEMYRPRAMNTRLRGTRSCGSAAIWAGGATVADVGTPAVDSDGVPLCCDALDLVGGDQDGGSTQGVLIRRGPVGGGLGLGGQPSGVA